MMASAMAVELMVTLLHHPHGAAADADADDGAAAGVGASPLGSVPHQIRSALSSFRTDCMVGRQFERCTACSDKVVGAYEEKGLDFLMAAFNRASYLEDLTGLTQMHAETEAALEDCVGFSDDDEDF
jgi:ubiquitin-like modifier-activating enzyme ATG7